MENFRTVLVWQRALRLAVRISHATRRLPDYERLELGTQMRRSARAVPANIAEACGRKVAGRSNADPLRVLVHASGELHELDSDVEYAREAEYWDPALANPLLAEITEIRRMLGSFMSYRRMNPPPSGEWDRDRLDPSPDEGDGAMGGDDQRRRRRGRR